MPHNFCPGRRGWLRPCGANSRGPASPRAAGCSPRRPLRIVTSPARVAASRQLQEKFTFPLSLRKWVREQKRRRGGWSPMRPGGSREDQTRLLFLCSTLKFRQEISLASQPLADRNHIISYYVGGRKYRRSLNSDLKVEQALLGCLTPCIWISTRFSLSRL